MTKDIYDEDIILGKSPRIPKPARQQPDPTPEEVAQRRSEGRTQGRKGCGVPAGDKFSLRLSHGNAVFLRAAAAFLGITRMELFNSILDKYRKANPELVQIVSVQDAFLKGDKYDFSNCDENYLREILRRVPKWYYPENDPDTPTQDKLDADPITHEP